MPFNYLDANVRKSIISEINGQENSKRRKDSDKQKEIYSDNILPFVKEYLEGFYSADAFKELPIIASINLAKRIVNQEASLYKECPKRTFTGVTEDQSKALLKIYEDMMFDSKMLKSNRYFRLQSQNDIYVIPLNGKLEMRVLLNHNFDVIPNPDDPNNAEAYILSTYDKALYLPRQSEDDDGSNQKIADFDDYKSTLKRYVFWSKDFNFIMDDQGMIKSDITQIANPLEGILPFVDIAPDKDFQFWVNQGQSVTDFTVQFNSTMTDIGQVVRMQGFAQGVLTGDADSLKGQNIQIGPMFVLKLPTNPQSTTQPDFKFVSPNADIQGSLKFLEVLMSNYLSSKGLSPNVVTGRGEADKFTSGLDRLLAMVELFEASKTDISLYKNAEKKLFKIIAKYINIYGGTDVLPDYKLGKIPDDADVEVMFERPQLIQSEMDKLGIIEKKIELGLIDQVGAVMIDNDFENRDDAQEYISKMDIPPPPVVPPIPAIPPLLNQKV